MHKKKTKKEELNFEENDFVVIPGEGKALVYDIDYKKKKVWVQFKEDGPIQSYTFAETNKWKLW